MGPAAENLYGRPGNGAVNAAHPVITHRRGPARLAQGTTLDAGQAGPKTRVLAAGNPVLRGR